MNSKMTHEERLAEIEIVMGQILKRQLNSKRICVLCGKEFCQHLNNEIKKKRITKFKFIGGK
jgi:hypothetical protein